MSTMAPPPAPAAARRRDQPVSSVRVWPGMRSEYTWLPSHDRVTVTEPHQIGVSFSEHRQAVLDRDGRAVELDIAAGSVFANGPQRVSWADVREPTEALEIYPDLELLRAAAAESSRAPTVEIEPATGTRDAAVLGIAAALKRAHVDAGYLGDVHASTLAHRLAEHLAAQYCGLGAARRPPPGRLDRVQLDRVDEAVAGRLAEALTLEDLASVAGLSPFHFARLFKASTGTPPHQYVTMRRMERAKTALLGSGRSVAEVAYAVGFLNLSHFRRVFRRHTGFTPSDLRAAR